MINNTKLRPIQILYIENKYRKMKRKMCNKIQSNINKYK